MAQAADPDTLIQEVKDCNPLDPAEVEDLIITILNMQEKFGDFKELITEELLVYVCKFCGEICSGNFEIGEMKFEWMAAIKRQRPRN